MLAQNIKTAEDLNITKADHAALRAVLGMLERDELTYVPPGMPPIPNGFRMSTVEHSTDCGTVACIMGWCRLVSNDEQVFDLFDGRYSSKVWRLFMYGDERRHKVTTSQAAAALRNYLTTGDAEWDEVLADA